MDKNIIAEKHNIAVQTIGTVGPNLVLETAKAFGIMPKYYLKWMTEIQQLTKHSIRSLDQDTLFFLAAANMDNKVPPWYRKELPKGSQLRLSL